jgi:hypothetical protein
VLSEDAFDNIHDPGRISSSKQWRQARSTKWETRRRLSVAIQRLGLVRERAEPKEIYALASLRLMQLPSHFSLALLFCTNETAIRAASKTRVIL